MTVHPVGFISYAHFDDRHDNGRLTELCARLCGEVRVQIGEEFQIFQDTKDIGWGQQWKQRIADSLDAGTFLFPIITPGFFKSAECRTELERFLEHERRLQRDDLILPIYYVNCPALESPEKRAADPLVGQIASRQYADWRDLRFEPFTLPEVGRRLEKMALQILAALERGRPAVAPSGPPAGAPSAAVATSRPSGSVGSPASASREQSRGGPAAGESALAPKSEPPTRVVDALHRGDHATIAEALAAALPGDRILVLPGLYREGLVVDKPVEIIGQGECGDIVIEATGSNAIAFVASMGRIANLTLRQMGGGDWYCVDITQGRLDLEGCDITSQSLTCVAIHHGADPRLRRNRIHDGMQGGVYVYENGRGTLEDNEIYGNALAGVEIKSGGNPTLRRNRIYEGKTGGVFVHENGQGTLADNEIFGNALAGVEIKTGSNPTLRRNRIHAGKGSGVFVVENGQGTLEDNEILANTLAGVEIKSGGNPTLRRNRIHDGVSCGVFVNEDGLGTLEDNEIHGNAFAGVEIRTGGNPILRRNRIHDGKQTGVFVDENGRGTLEDNELVGNALAGVEIRAGGNPTLRRNRISKNGYEAIWVHDGGEGTFEHNDLRGNTKGAWDIAADCEERVRRTDNQEE